MKRLFIFFTAIAMLTSFSMTAMAEETDSKTQERVKAGACSECDGGTLYSQEKGGIWNIESLLACGHGLTQGLDRNEFRKVYTVLECDNCDYTSKEWTGVDNRSLCWGYGEEIFKGAQETRASKANAIIPEPDTEVLKQGKALLAEHDVKDNQTIHFAYNEILYQSHGANAVTSLADAKSKYPDWTIPEKLGSYKFIDFTLYPERTSILFPDMLPAYQKELPVLTDGKPSQYFLCYGDGANQFRIEVLPLTEGKFTLEDVRQITMSLSSLPAQVEIKFEPEKENDTSLFHSFWVVPETNGKYAFFIQKVEGTDCLESNSISITDKEALSIYEALQKDFA